MQHFWNQTTKCALYIYLVHSFSDFFPFYRQLEAFVSVCRSLTQCRLSFSSIFFTLSPIAAYCCNFFLSFFFAYTFMFFFQLVVVFFAYQLITTWSTFGFFRLLIFSCCMHYRTDICNNSFSLAYISRFSWWILTFCCALYSCELLSLYCCIAVFISLLLLLFSCSLFVLCARTSTVQHS